jgi:hypothetical protein
MKAAKGEAVKAGRARVGSGMFQNYSDITERIAETPKWWDENGVPRYAEFEPRRAATGCFNLAVLQYRRRDFLRDWERNSSLEIALPEILRITTTGISKDRTNIR